ncbi:hypothetical protein DRN43_02365, partial [Thermococci archaeon]
IMNILEGGRVEAGLEIERAGGKIYFTLTGMLPDYAIYDPQKQTFITKYAPIHHRNLKLEGVKLQVPGHINKLKIKWQRKWFITRKAIVNWDYAPHFQPDIYLQGIIWSNEGIKAWLQRWKDGFAYVAVLGTVPQKIDENVPLRFYEREAYIAQGEFKEDTIQVVHNESHSPKIPPRKVIEYLGLKEGR